MKRVDQLLPYLLPRVSVGDCWEWRNAKDIGGYGRIGVLWQGTKHKYAHRLVYSVLVGEIPKGLWIDHLCQNTRCCNPDHLQVVSPSTNLKRSPKRGKGDFCGRGHRILVNRQNVLNLKWGCRACNREDQERFHQ